MTIKEIKTADLIPYANNPRNNDNAVEAVANSIKEFGFKVPIVIDKNKVIVAGHTRLKAAQKLGLEKVPCIIADDLTPEQIDAFRLADNKTGELAEWNDELLQLELNKLNGIIQMDQFGFSELEEELNELDHDNPYSQDVKIPHYEPTGEKVAVSDLCDETKTNQLIEEIESAKIPEDIKHFLRMAAYRHTVFNFKKIAEYYSNANEDIQELFEKSALVIVDMNDAMANGWIKLTKTIEELIEYEQ